MDAASANDRGIQVFKITHLVCQLRRVHGLILHGLAVLFIPSLVVIAVGYLAYTMNMC